MGVELNIKDNLKGDVVNANQYLTSFDTQNELLDKILDDELYNQELYNGGVGSRYDGSGTAFKDIFLEIVNSSTNYDVSNIDKFSDVDIDNVLRSYNKTADMYRNQTAVSKYVDHKKDMFEKRNKSLLLDVSNKIREKEIYTYYYKKYNAQKKILMNIISASALTIVLIYLNKNFKFILNDTLFVLALGIIFAVLVIRIFIELFDILFRSNINYDEYDFMFRGRRSTDELGEQGSYLGKQWGGDKDKISEKCDAEIKAYKGIGV